jgi:hypothetical protein
MKKVLLVLGGVLIVLIVLATFGYFFGKPLLAHGGAVLTQSVDEPGRNPYQERKLYSFTGVCGLSTCGLDFKPVPAGSRLVVTNISGSLKLQGSVVVDEIYLLEAGGGTGLIRMNVPTQYEGSANGLAFRQFNEQVHLYVEPLKTPSVEVQLSGNPGAFVQNIALAGYYIKLP